MARVAWGEAGVGADTGRRLPPLWLGNLMAFGLLIVLVLAWFSVQSRQAQQVFHDEAARQARLLSEVVGLHARGVVRAQAVTDGILAAFLGNAARFVDYLDGVEPFQSDELTAFAAQSGLSVIRVVRDGGATQGPAGWTAGAALECGGPERLLHLPEAHTLLLGVRRSQGGGCVLVGMDSRQVDELRRELGMAAALNALQALPGVVRVSMEDAPLEGESAPAPQVRLRRLPGGGAVAETRTPVAGGRLLLDLDAGPWLREEARLWRDFILFALLLGLFGGLGTWILYRHQQIHDSQLRAYERTLSRQREEAGLGRAAASIAHEIRNPLNTMGMGLQRLEMEVPELDKEHRRLLSLVRAALRRTDDTVRGLLDYARPYRPRLQPIDLDGLLRDQLELIRGRIGERGVRLDLDLNGPPRLAADPELLRSLLDNLLRNALEAVPDGGELRIATIRVVGGVELRMANDGLALTPDEVQKLLDPWFTTKTGGTGLGLAISRRIAAAHGGELKLTVPRPGWLGVTVFLSEH